MIAVPGASLATPAMAAAAKNYVKISQNAIGHTRALKLGLNKSMVIDLPDDAHDILVANPEVADAVTRTSRRIYVFAKQVGETNIFIFDRNGNQLVSLDLAIERDVAGLEKYIEKYIRGADVTVEIVNDNIILTGTVPTPQDSVKAVQLAQIFVRGGEATTPPSGSASSLPGGGTFISFGQDETRESTIVNLLTIDAEDQVSLKVTVAEIQRNVVKQLGIDLLSSLSIGGLATQLITDNPMGLGKVGSSSRINNSYSHGDFDFSSTLRALDQAGVMRTLAEPTLTAISGEAATFNVGGEYRIASGKSDNGTDVTYEVETVEYGISLGFKPVVLSPGRISLNIQTEVSEPTNEGNFAIPRGGVEAVTYPGIRRRRAETTVELPSGGSMVIAGLIKDDVRQVVSGFPGLGKIPIIGTLFRSREFQRFESELVIIVTPYLVRPVARHQLARPDDNFQAVTDGAGIFLGRVNQIYGTASGQMPAGQYRGNPGFILR
ncbi:MAG: type II and III secretion system protein family protein [Nitratireductor sp.]|nr:type II and III secretion system protein family protein [Nitratireductor sp.]